MHVGKKFKVAHVVSIFQGLLWLMRTFSQQIRVSWGRIFSECGGFWNKYVLIVNYIS